MKSRSSMVAVLVVFLATLAPAAYAADAATAATTAPSAASHPVPIFDNLRSVPDVIYLVASSSIVFGPDPHARSEEITFAGFVTVPKWPMPGYQRRVLPDGREQIDIELIKSELTGESFLLGGKVKLGEHPDLRSLGTITQRAPQAVERRASLAPADAPPQQAAAAAAPAAEGAGFTFPITENLEKLMAKNPYVLWDDLIAGELRQEVERQPEALARKPRIVPPPNASLVERSAKLPPDLVRKMKEQQGVDWRGHLYQAAEVVAADLLQRQVIEASGDSFNPALIPNDFVVARKVLITTAKGILYNETAVPVRGSITAIPPVRTRNTPVGINVFRGMELPAALLDEKGEVNGWFYSKAHMAYAVKPDAIQRNQLRATAELRQGDRREQVALAGPIEIHHTRDGAATDGEVMVLALRGRSELLGGEVMMIEAFSDRDRFSSGPLKASTGGGVDWDFDLHLQVYTPSAKLETAAPLHLAGSFGGIRAAGDLARGNLSIPLLSGVAGDGSRPFVSTRGGKLIDEAGRPAAELVRLELTIAAD